MKKRRREDRDEDEFDFFDIDKHGLDVEWVRQPRLYFDYSLKLEDARQDLERAKAELDLTCAELERSIREDPDEYDITKVTEAAIKAAIPVQKVYQDALQNLNNARHQVGVYQAACNALDHRKRALEKLVDLWAKEYYATPRASEDGVRAQENYNKEVRRKKKRQDDD